MQFDTVLRHIVKAAVSGIFVISFHLLVKLNPPRICIRFIYMANAAL